MNINTKEFTPAATRAQLVMAQLEDTCTGAIATRQSPPPTIIINHRDNRGRFSIGCRPGPGRPRKVIPRQFVSPLSLYERVIEMDNSVVAWKSIINRLGPSAARAFLADFEAEKGQVTFRHLVLDAIAAAEKEALNPKPKPKRKARKKSVSRKKAVRKRAVKRKAAKRVARHKDKKSKNTRRRIRPLSNDWEDEIMHESIFDQL